MLKGQAVYVAYADAYGVVVGWETPWLSRWSDDDTPLYEVHLDDGRVCYALSSQLVAV